MSKTIEDYRDIVKVLKLQLLKVREDNTSLSKTLGIAPENQISSFSPRLQRYKNNPQQFSKHMYLFSLFAHKCELIGVYPEMVFRIADKKRDKKVSVASLTQILKRLKIKFDDVEASRLLQMMTKSDHIFYEEYLQYLSAFQINSEKYPFKSQRTYAQLCMLKFGSSCKDKNIKADKLYSEILSGENRPYLKFEQFTQFCRGKTNLKDVEVVAVFVALDTHSECQIDNQIFNREMGKVFQLLDRGVSFQNENVSIQDDKKVSSKKSDKNDSDDEVKLDIQTGQEAGNKKGAKKPKKNVGKLVKGDSGKLVNEMKKQGIKVHNLISKMLGKEEKRKLIRPFSLLDFHQAIQEISKNSDKKKTINFFKCMDSSNNGSISTDELIKLWLEGREMTDPAEILYKLLKRHFLEIQCSDVITRFTTLGYEAEETMNLNMLNDVFSNLQLEEDYMKNMEALFGKCTVKSFVNDVLQQGKKISKNFIPMKRDEFEKMNQVIKKLVPKGSKNFPKFIRMENNQQKSMSSQYWETIFTDEWACWEYCLTVASKLTAFWRDPEFGPTQGDAHGYRSIVGNESEVPPGLPFEDEIIWLTFEQMLEKQNDKSDVKLFSKNLSANDIIQGKLGDCWFVSSLSIIASNDEYIRGKDIKQCRTNPENLIFGAHPILFQCFDKYGLYVFKFYKNFKPVFVVLDDLFPVEVSSFDLIFAKSPDAGLQWVPFLEKAYAKLHHCYSNMISGDISQGLCDLTNRLPIKQELNSDKTPQQLLQKMQKLSREKQLMGCSITAPKGARVEQPVELNDERTGLFYSHAYSIGDVIHLKATDKEEFDLIRLRNPWGNGEWILDWSDSPVNNDPDYAKLVKYQKDLDTFYEKKIKEAKKMREADSQIEPYKPGNDGQFLMSFHDFAQIYSNLFIGYYFKEKEYMCQFVTEQWNPKTPSGICKIKGSTDAERTKFVKDNHQYVMQIKEPTDVLIMLIQRDGRLFRGEKYPYKQVCDGINILVFTLGNDKSLEKFDTDKMTLKKLKFELRREVDFWHRFQAGRYAIIPCKLKNQIIESQIELRVYSQSSVVLKKVKGPPNDFKILPKTSKLDNPEGLSSILDILSKQ